MQNEMNMILQALQNLDLKTSHLVEEMHEVREDLKGVHEDLKGVHVELESLHKETREIREDLKGVHADLESLHEENREMRADLRSIQLTMENELISSIRIVAEGHLDLSRRLKEMTDYAQKQEMMEVRVSHLESEVRQIKQHMAS